MIRHYTLEISLLKDWLVSALRDCCAALEEEADAACGDEHPTIRAHRNLARRSRALLENTNHARS